MVEKAKRKPKGVYRDKVCGCTFTDHAWVVQCDKHQAEHDAIKKQWHLDYEEFKKKRYA